MGFVSLRTKKQAWQTITVNGTLAWHKGAHLAGAPGISGASENSRYIMFNAEPGTWRFTASTDPNTANQSSAPVTAPFDKSVRVRTTPRKLEIFTIEKIDFTAEVFDQAGKMISPPIRSESGFIRIPHRSLGHGVFFIRVNSGKSITVRKVIITH